MSIAVNQATCFWSVHPVQRMKEHLGSFLLVAGLLFPTSIASDISKPLSFLHSAVFISTCLFLILIERSADVWTCVNSLLILATILISSLISRLHDYRPGAIIGFLGFAILCTVDLRDLRISQRFFLAVNTVNIAAGLAMFLGSQGVDDFVLKYFSTAYPELLPYMIAAHRPVLMFGTHSLAAMAFYILFWLCLETYKTCKSRVFLVCAFGYAVLALMLTSVSGVLLGAVMFGQLSWLGFRSKWYFRVLLIVIALGIVVCLPWQDIISTASDVLGSSGNGFAGRYSGQGALSYAISYIAKYPFAPIGFTYNPALSLIGDSGLIQYLIRGSLPLLALMYVAAFRFFKRNLYLSRDALRFIVLIPLFELGFTILTNARMLYLLPFAVIYLNDLRTRESGNFRLRQA